MTKPDAIRQVLSTLEKVLEHLDPAATLPLLVAYSGGVDSQVLLHALHTLRSSHILPLTLRAIHIDHGLHSDSYYWRKHCQLSCERFNIPFRGIKLKLQPQPGESVEALARSHRYRVFAEHLQPSEYLVTAHHQDDQAETLFLNLLRGSGGMGLAAMPQKRRFHQGYLLRPLLSLPRNDLMAYAQHEQLTWQDDPSNENQRFDRNYLRHTVLPVLEQRWPSWRKTVSRSAEWQSEQQQLLSALLSDKLLTYQGQVAGTLSVATLLKEELVMQKALLRHWLRQQDFPAPSAKKLQHILRDVLVSAIDASPCVAWPGCEIRRYHGDIYALIPQPLQPAEQEIIWSDIEQALAIPSLKYSLPPHLLADWCNYLTQQKKPLVTVRFRQGGESIKRKKRPGIRLKQFLQDKNVPPWERGRIPLIYIGQTLVQVVGLLSLLPDEVEL